MVAELQSKLYEAMMLIEMMDGDTSGIHCHGFTDSDLTWGAHSIIQSIANGKEMNEQVNAMLSHIHTCADEWCH